MSIVDLKMNRLPVKSKNLLQTIDKIQKLIIFYANSLKTPFPISSYNRKIN